MCNYKYIANNSYTFLYNKNIVIFIIVHYYIYTIIYYTNHYSHL